MNISYLEVGIAFVFLAFWGVHVVCFGYMYHDIPIVTLGVVGTVYGVIRGLWCIGIWFRKIEW